MTSASLGGAVNPGLCIPNVGDIRLPISAEDAKAITQSCHPSPFGKGTETLVDESVRKSWQLDANQFALQNPHWQIQVEGFVKKAVTGLGLTANGQEVKAELYKLLIYQEGAFFLPHQDSEKADGMFGTLAICLPSEHEGGDVIASHRGDQLRFRTAPSSKFGFSWAAWYADITHEVKPVISGYRVVLIYNLIHRPSAALLEFHGSRTEKITRLLESWARVAEMDTMQYLGGWDDSIDDTCPPALVYVLEHEYTSAELGFSRLKGVDQDRFAELRDACQRAGFDIFLANIEKTDTGGVEEDYGGYYYGHPSGDTHTIIDLVESRLELSHVVDSEGIVVGNNVPFPEDMLIQKDIFDRDPDDEEFEDFTGNEGASTTHFYHESGALIIPKRFSLLFKIQQLKNGECDTERILEDCHSAVSKQPNDMLAKERLLQVYRAITPVKRPYDSSRREQGRAMQVALELSDLELFCRSMEWLDNESFSSHTDKIAQAISQNGFNAIRSSLDKVFRGTMYPLHISLSSRLHMLSSLAKEYHSLCEQQGKEQLREVSTWLDITFNDIICHIRSSESDGHALANAISECPIPGSLSRVMPILEKRLDHAAFIIAFITSAHGNSLTGSSNKGEADAVLKALLLKLLEHFKFGQAACSYPNRGAHGWIFYRDRLGVPSRISLSLVMKLIQFANSTDYDTTGIFTALTEYFLTVKETEKKSAFHDFLFPIADGICADIDTTQRSPTGSERQFITQMLLQYLNHYVKEAPPPPPPDWGERMKIRCTCTECGRLRRFVNDTSKKTQDFALVAKTRKHLEEQLDKTYYTTTTIKQGTPHKLRVDKTRALLVTDVAAWGMRAQYANTLLHELSKNRSLKEMLGNQYDSIFAHRNLVVPDNLPAIPGPSSTNAQCAVQRTVPAKRPRGH
ncbi:hypothetical protein BDV26DRAFT_295802 [Aspergillus bertholletiae]|uniref:Prolyl 4-hydroxylase alpha subunit Fe(2+) 2OG dioxygenase domain-containing protein n=1 Tax=Aspergillus bertholletiae TaxID=1226010 RepID=A0A5N7AXK5_9EURO|nr:hypothetical protein BDV26DRAFT_295802 [Aspergillus bertholletiae]